MLPTFTCITKGLFPTSRNYLKQVFELSLLTQNTICCFERMVPLDFTDLTWSESILAPNTTTIILALKGANNSPPYHLLTNFLAMHKQLSKVPADTFSWNPNILWFWCWDVQRIFSPSCSKWSSCLTTSSNFQGKKMSAKLRNTTLGFLWKEWC